MKEKKFGNNLKVNLIVLLVVTIIYNVLCIFLSQNQNYSIRYEFAFDYKIIILWIVNYVAIIFALIFFDKLKKNIGYVTFAIGVLAMFVLLDIGIFSIGKIFGGIIILNSIIYLSNYDIVNGNKEIDLIEEEKSFHKNKKKLKINLIIQLCINVVLGILIIIAYLNSKTSITKSNSIFTLFYILILALLVSFSIYIIINVVFGFIGVICTIKEKKFPGYYILIKEMSYIVIVYYWICDFLKIYINTTIINDSFMYVIIVCAINIYYIYLCKISYKYMKYLDITKYIKNNDTINNNPINNISDNDSNINPIIEETNNNNQLTNNIIINDNDIEILEDE